MKKLDAEKIIHMYLNEGMTPTAISEKYRVNVRMIQNILNKNGVKKSNSKHGEWDKPIDLKPLEHLKSDEDTCYYPKREIRVNKYTDKRGKVWSDVTGVFGG